jgi:hypothetical protein
MTETREPWAACTGVSARKYYGKYAAIVADNKQLTAHSEHRGYLTVDIPGLLEEAPPTGSANRPLKVTAQPSFLPGFFFVPEVGAQVWVEFVAGDINWPIWTGVWYPKDLTPATVDGQRPTLDQKVIRTKSGQVIQLEDTDKGERTVIRDEKNDNRVTLSKDLLKLEGAGNVVTMDTNGIALTDANGNSLKLESGGITLTAGSGKKVTLVAASAKVEVAGAPPGVKLTDAGGSLKPAALAPILDWLLAHQHIGNMGAPTPLFPGDMAQLLPKKIAGIDVQSGMG